MSFYLNGSYILFRWYIFHLMWFFYSNKSILQLLSIIYVLSLLYLFKFLSAHFLRIPWFKFCFRLFLLIQKIAPSCLTFSILQFFNSSIHQFFKTLLLLCQQGDIICSWGAKRGFLFAAIQLEPVRKRHKS